MKVWTWTKNGLISVDSVKLTPLKPTLITFGGCFNVDDPAQSLCYEPPLVKAFFEHILRYVAADPQEFRRLICGPLDGKLKLNYFSARKLLGLISGVPQQAEYPETLDGLFSDEVEFFEISYTNTQGCFENNLRSHSDIQFISKDAVKCAEVIFSPLVEAFSEKALSTLCQKLSLITLFGISYGSNFIIELENALCALLETKGYPDSAKKLVLSSIYTVAVSNTANVRAAKEPRTTAVYFQGSNDKLAPWMNPHRNENDEYPAFGIERLAENRLLVSLPITVEASRWIETIPEFDYLWLDIDKAAHYTPFYTMRCLPFNLAPELLERVLRNFVTRSGDPVPFSHIFKKTGPYRPQVEDNSQNSDEIKSILELTGYSIS